MAGNAELLKKNNIEIDSKTPLDSSLNGSSLTYLGEDGAYAGYIALADEMKEGAKEDIAALRSKGYEVYLVSGDNEASANALASSVGITHGTGPLSDNDFYKDNMHLTSRALEKIGDIGGPRCCKRNAYISLTEAAKFVEERYHIKMTIAPFKCEFSPQNPTCLKTKCLYYPQ